jgi:hypothetical protein
MVVAHLMFMASVIRLIVLRQGLGAREEIGE